MKPTLRVCLDWCIANKQQLRRYVIVGASSFVIDAGIFEIVRRLGVWYILATVISQSCAITYNFLLNKHWSFKSEGRGHREFIRYLLLVGWNNLFQVVFLALAVEIIHLPHLLAKVLGAGLVVSWTFLLYRLWVFKSER